jgi:hypothetical protein
MGRAPTASEVAPRPWRGDDGDWRGNFDIGFDFPVFEAISATPTASDLLPVPVVPGGAIEGTSSYSYCA